MIISQKVQQYIDQKHLFGPNDTLLVALSGGADSVAMLILLRELGYRLVAAHCNFQLRGSESERDQQFVERLCLHLHIQLHTQRFDTNTYAKEKHVSIEMAARELRYEWFERLRQRIGAQYICIAHHQDDNIETMLLNLIRGTGLRGLCGMQPMNGHLRRPLLCLTREQLHHYLDERAPSLQLPQTEGNPFVVDSSNLSSEHYARNKVRLQLLPLLRSINPGADSNLADTIENMNQAWNVYRYCIDEFAGAALDGPSELDIATIMRCPSPLALLHELLTPFGFNRPQLVSILQSIHHVGAQFQSSSHRLVIDRSQLIIDELTTPYPSSPGLAVSTQGNTLAPEELATAGITLSIVPNTPDFQFSPSPQIAYFDASHLTAHSLHIRTVKTGDRIVPFGMKGSRLVSDVLTDLKLNRLEKEQQLLLLFDSEIAWIVGRRSSDLFRVNEQTKEIAIMKFDSAACKQEEDLALSDNDQQA